MYIENIFTKITMYVLTFSLGQTVAKYFFPCSLNHARIVVMLDTGKCTNV